jgi:hypothetical protein
MVIEKFSKQILKVGLFHTYIATGFFASLIFFIVNMEYYTAYEMMIGTIFFTVLLKGITQLMFSMIILLFKLDNKKQELIYEEKRQECEKLIGEIKLFEVNKELEKEKSYVGK